jgi:hypothetical protein
VHRKADAKAVDEARGVQRAQSGRGGGAGGAPRVERGREEELAAPSEGVAPRERARRAGERAEEGERDDEAALQGRKRGAPGGA